MNKFEKERLEKAIEKSNQELKEQFSEFKLMLLDLQTDVLELTYSINNLYDRAGLLDEDGELYDDYI